MFRYRERAASSVFGMALVEYGDELTAVSPFILCIWWERWILPLGPLALRAIISILNCLN